MAKKENIFNDRVKEIESYLTSVENHINEDYLNKSKETIDNLIASFNEEIIKETKDLTPHIMTAVQNFINKETSKFENSPTLKNL